MTEHYCFSTPLGEWTVYARDGALVRLVFEKTEGGEKTPLLAKAADQPAETAGNGKACRAAGGANNKNPLPVFIFCHRVIGADGSPGGYGGGLKTKQFPLELEKKCR